MTDTVSETLKKVTDTIPIKIHEWAVIKTGELTFSSKLLDYCKSNACGNYNKTWTCPPACESLEEQREKILSYENALVFTTKHKLDDSFDYEGMNSGRELHILLTADVRDKFSDTSECSVPVFGAGACPVCKSENSRNSCAFPQPCPYPEKRIGSIEAAGINVTELSKTAGIAYNNGLNTVTYFSMVLLK